MCVSVHVMHGSGVCHMTLLHFQLWFSQLLKTVLSSPVITQSWLLILLFFYPLYDLSTRIAERTKLLISGLYVRLPGKELLRAHNNWSPERSLRDDVFHGDRCFDLCIWFISWCIPRPCSPRHLYFVPVGLCLGDEPEPWDRCVPQYLPVLPDAPIERLAGASCRNFPAWTPAVLSWQVRTLVLFWPKGRTPSREVHGGAPFTTRVWQHPVTELQIDCMTWSALNRKLICLSVIIWVQGLAGPILSPFSPGEKSTLWCPHYRGSLTTLNEESGDDSFKRLSCQTWLVSGKHGMPVLLRRWVLPNQAHFPAGFMGQGVVLHAGEQVLHDSPRACAVALCTWEDCKIQISHLKRSHSFVSELTCEISLLVWSSALLSLGESKWWRTLHYFQTRSFCFLSIRSSLPLV